MQLTGQDYIKLIPMAVGAAALTYYVIKAVRCNGGGCGAGAAKSCDGNCKCHLNKTIRKDEEKVRDVFQADDLGEKTSFCRCWKSRKFPYCDGSHNAHNSATGDNVGPVYIHKKAA